MIAEIVTEYLIEMAVLGSSTAAIVAADQARRINRKLSMVEDHDRALYGDDATGWPGLMPLATDGGEDQ